MDAPARLGNGATLSVVIPCFNAENYIAASLASVDAQGWPDLEVVVVDDGSSDRSADIVRSRFPGATLLRQPNRGVAAARNFGLAQARGDWIAFLDADDIWLPGKLDAQARGLAAEPAARMACAAWQVWPSAEPEPSAAELAEFTAPADGPPDRWAGPSGWIYPQLLLDCEVWTSTVVVHRTVLDEVGGFDPALRIGEDYDLWLRASRVTPIVRVARPLALYRMHPQSITRGVPEVNYRNLVVSRALERWGYASPDGSAARKPDVDRALAQSWSAFAGAQLQAGHFERARRASALAVRADPRHAAGWKVLARSLARWR